jgi:diguanylate cyclase (GGDEF)-like protein
VHGFLAFLEAHDRRWTWFGTLCAWGAIAWLHSLIGWEISFSIVYLLPIGIAAWVLGRAGGTTISVLSAAGWWYANRAVPLDPETILYWNTFVRLTLFIIVSDLLSRLKSALDRERALARTDPLTGLANSLAFTETAEREIAVARRTNRSLSLIWIDLDGFKDINDKLGHAAGDEVLAQVGAALRRSTRRTDVAARMGGDEFAVLLPETDMAGVSVIVEKIIAGVGRSVEVEGQRVSMSVGALACEQVLPDLDVILRKADDLMYEVKRTGKGASRIDLCSSLDVD